MDWRVSLTDAAKVVNLPVQGNLDPTLLAGKWSSVEKHAQRILDEGRSLNGFVFNLGHGIQPNALVENVEKLVALVKAS